MSARAYSEPYAYDRRHARNKLSQKNATNTKPVKSADIIPLVPRQLNQSKSIELVYPKYRKLSSSAATLLIVGLHILVFGYFYFSPPPAFVKPPEPPKIKLEKYVPPVIPPQQIKPEPPKPQKKEPPKVVKQQPIVERENPNVIEQVVQPPAPVAEAPKAEPVTGPSADANYLHNPAPVYPEQAQTMGWEGTVVLNVFVFANGTVKDINVKQSSGRKVLDEAAIQTVKRWSFVPARQGETAVEAWVEVPIDFRLSQ